MRTLSAEDPIGGTAASAHLQHVYQTCPLSIIAQLNSHTRLSDSFDSVLEDDSRDKDGLIGCDYELFLICRTLEVQLQLCRSKALPLAVCLLHEKLALHLCCKLRCDWLIHPRTRRRTDILSLIADVSAIHPACWS